MITHEGIGSGGFATNRRLWQLIQTGEISLGGNRRLKIYGKLHCRSGKRMKTANRVFFANEQEAIMHGYRPCGHCMREDYLRWKASLHRQRTPEV